MDWLDEPEAERYVSETKFLVHTSMLARQVMLWCSIVQISCSPFNAPCLSLLHLDNQAPATIMHKNCFL